MNPRIRSSVGVVKAGEHAVEFFKGNIRRSVVLKINPEITEIICALDGKRTLAEIEKQYGMDGSAQAQFECLIRFLQEKGIVVDDSRRVINQERIIYSRVFSMLEDYASSEAEVQRACPHCGAGGSGQLDCSYLGAVRRSKYVSHGSRPGRIK